MPTVAMEETLTDASPPKSPSLQILFSFGPGRPKLTSDEELSGIIVKTLLEARWSITRSTDVDMKGSAMVQLQAR